MTQYDALIKVLILGDQGVGKSSLTQTFAEERFKLNQLPTIGVDFRVVTKHILVNDQTLLTNIQLWDTAGQERFRSITQSYYRGAHAAIFVFDKTNEESFLNIEQWIDDVREAIPERIEMIVVGNKADLIDSCVISTESGNALARRLKLPYFETSAKTNHMVQEAFTQIAQNVLKDNVSVSVRVKPKNDVIVVPDYPTRSYYCCY